MRDEGGGVRGELFLPASPLVPLPWTLVMHCFMIVIRCAVDDIPVRLFQNLDEAIGAAKQLVQDIRSNYSILHTYAKITKENGYRVSDPLNVSIYEFLSDELKLVIGYFPIDASKPSTRSGNMADRMHVGAHSE